MYIAITLKRYRAVKEVGKIKMSVGVIVYYQLVQVCQVINLCLFSFQCSHNNNASLLEFVFQLM